MGDNGIKGKGLPRLGSAASLPKLGSLSKPKSSLPSIKATSPSKTMDKVESPVFSEDINSSGPTVAMPAPSLEDFNLEDFNVNDDPTEVGSTDDLLAAINGIDGWDDVSSISMSIQPHLDIALDDKSGHAAGSDVSDAMPTSDSPSLEFKTPAAASAPVAAAPIAAAPVAPAPIAAPVAPAPIAPPPVAPVPVAPAPVAPAPVAPVPVAPAPVAPAPAEPEVPAAPVAPEVPTAPAVPEVPATPAAPVETAAPVAPEVPAAPAAPAPAMPAAPAATPQIPENAHNGYEAVNAAPAQGADIIDAEQPEMSDEEQYQALLASMTPQERDEYEAHVIESRRLEAERQRAKQKEMMEMYSSSITTDKSSPIGLIIVIALIVIGIIAAIAILVSLPNQEEEPKAEVQAEVVEEEEPAPPVRAPEMPTTPVTIDISGASTVYVNGIKVDGSKAKFVKGRSNTVMAFGSHSVPYFKTFAKTDAIPDQITETLEPDTLYDKGTIAFRLENIEQGALQFTATFDGMPLSSFPQKISNVVLGRPHVLILEAKDMGKHMHLIWPNSSETTVTIPELRTANEAQRDTTSKIRKFPQSSKPYGIRIATGERETSSADVVSVTPGDMIEYSIKREQRYPLQFAVIPDGYGTLSMDTSLLHKSIGESVVTFKRKKADDYWICIRRVGEVICPEMEKEVTVPSGTDWEIFPVGGSKANPTVLRGIQKQELQSSRKYVFETSFDAKHTMKLEQVSYSRIKK